ncbi:lipopolysaccharide export system protein LptC [Novosphingobium sp. PhB165]|uniref:LPS export ABC transporter periplasmic protein LptC n=1 Tax=Novosphingobium sp. PhB165 TaxID=2485105 RepID=UPI00104F7993|nr:LPS export ABC transporter periplasmic protein LptC [Novosphingobium sp. PhB165]TCM16925.1 lipopolysaccharide export system protein LptC [Novosphingobium sp. PhB165]
MSEEAIQILNRRRHFAAPGGSHDRLVGFLAKALPTGIGVVAAVMILVPLSPRGEISFLLDRNKVAVTTQRIAVANAAYRGQDNAGREFLVTAGTAVQHSPDVPVVEMLDLNAKMNMKDGPATIAAPRGAYNFEEDTMKVSGPVNFNGAGGYNMTTKQVDIDIKQKTAVASGGVSGAGPSGTFSANSMHADLDNRTVTLEGNARMRITPGQLRIPQ